LIVIALAEEAIGAAFAARLAILHCPSPQIGGPHKSISAVSAGSICGLYFGREPNIGK
jgi:hypothetical protein